MTDDEPRDTRWTDTGSLLSAGPSAVVAFTLSVLVRRAITVGVADWELVLGRAAIALAAVAIVYRLLMLLGAAVHMD